MTGDEGSREPSQGRLPRTVEVFRPDCPLALDRFTSVTELLGILGPQPRVFVLGLGRLAALDPRGARMVRLLASRCSNAGITLIVGGARPQAAAMLARAGLLDEIGPQNVFQSMREALARARVCAHR